MTLTVELLRPEDLVSLTVEATNLMLDTSDPAHPVLKREDPGAAAFLVIVFPPQSVLEEAFFEPDPADLPQLPGDPRKAPGDVLSRLSGPSRLAFRVPDEIPSIPFTISGLLDWTMLQPSLAPIAALVGQPFFPPDTPPPRVVPPSAQQTAIELPLRLIISPGPGTRWRHALQPVTRAGRTEIWHTRLAPTGGDGGELSEDKPGNIRAIFSPDYNEDEPPPLANEKPFRSSLRPLDRHQLVQLTSTFGLQRPGFTSDLGKPAQAARLALSALGGSLHADGRWPDKPTDVSLVSWRHEATFGRDSYVRIVRRGRLFPFTHRASLVTVVERRFESWPTGDRKGRPVSYLRQFQCIDGIQIEVSYTGEAFAAAGREMPLASLVRINTRNTPHLDDPVFIPIPGSGIPLVLTGSREVRVGNALFPFALTAVDAAGSTVDFTSPMIFVPDEDIPGNLGAVAVHWLNNISKADRAALVANRPVAIAVPTPDSHNTTFATSAMHFDVQLGSGPGGFLPRLSSLEVRVPSIEAVTGSDAATEISLFKRYLDGGFSDTMQVFAKVERDLPVAFAADQAGGFAKPDMSVAAFTRSMGPVAGDINRLADGKFDPAAAFKGLDAKLFGAINLGDIIGAGELGATAPKITTDVVPSAAAPAMVVTMLSWQVKATKKDVGPLSFEPIPPRSGDLLISVVITKPIARDGAAGSPSTLTVGTLNDFTLTLFGALAISFSEFRFTSSSGGKPSVDVKLSANNPLEFKGALGFVQKLTQLIPPGLFGDNGPTVTLKPTAIAVDFALALPPAALGVFTIRNIAISTTLTLPFLSGLPSFAFGFASRQRPFQVAVLILGGGGFFRIELDTQGVRLVEGMLEFGGVLALDVGIASGSVSIMAGIYFAFGSTESEITGFVDVSGEVTVLAIVSVSVNFNLSLTYYFKDNVVKGVATVSVSVRVAFLSKSVSFSVERSFSAGSEHISIAAAMTPQDWRSYSDAFA